MTEIVLRMHGVQRSFFNRNDAQGDDRAPPFSVFSPTEMLLALENHIDLLSKELLTMEAAGDSQAAEIVRNKIMSLRSDIDLIR